MTRILALALVFSAFSGLAAEGASAHSQSYGFLNFALADDTVEGRIELAARDLDAAYQLDANADGVIVWGEYRSREAEIAGAVLDRIAIGAAGQSCSLSGGPSLVDLRGGETYIVIPFRGGCPPIAGPVEIGYDLLFDLDAQHRGIVAATVGGESRSLVMTPEARRASLGGEAQGGIALFLTFVAHGAHHIWIGYDHILFLVTLLLGTVVTRQSGTWKPVDRIGSAMLAAAKVVTAFTLAHSLTLGLAAFGILRIPTALTESVIAATIILAAFNNIWPVVTRRLWLVAFVFGLIHGVGFANVLADLDLPRQGLVTALFAFNLGVELGQLAIVVMVLPILVLAGRRPLYGRIALPAFSLLIAAIGAAWFVERAAGVAMLPSG